MSEDAKREGFVDSVTHVLRGVGMGAADTVPGVSGGTVALILGIYPRLIGAIAGVDAKLFRAAKSRDWTGVSKRLDLSLTVPLGLGIAIGIASLAGVVTSLRESHPEELYASFFGFVLASTLLVGRMVGSWKPVTIGFLVAGALLAFFLLGANEGSLLPFNESDVGKSGYLFVSGSIAICAMILPGISGAYILALIHKENCYEYVLQLVKKTVSLDATWGELGHLLAFAFGCLIGLLIFSKFIKLMLERARSVTLALLCGFMVGSLRGIWPFRTDAGGLGFPAKIGDAWMPLVCMVGGVVLVLVVDRLSKQVHTGEGAAE